MAPPQVLRLARPRHGVAPREPRASSLAGSQHGAALWRPQRVTSALPCGAARWRCSRRACARCARRPSHARAHARGGEGGLFPPGTAPPAVAARARAAVPARRRSPRRGAASPRARSDGGAEPAGGRGPVPGGQGAAGLPQAARVALLHLRLRHLRQLLGLLPPQRRMRQPQREQPQHRRGLRLPLQAAPGVLRGPHVPGRGPGEGVPGGRLLVGRRVLRHRGRLRLPLRPGRPRRLPLPRQQVPGEQQGARHRPGGHGGAGLPVAGELLRLGQGAGRRQGGDGPRRRAGPAAGLPAPGDPLPRPAPPPHLRPQHLRGLRLPQPGAVDGQHLVRVQGDGLGGSLGPRPPRGGPREAGGPRGLRPRRGGLRAARGRLPARLRPGRLRPPRGGVRPRRPHLLRQPDVGSSPTAGGAEPRSRPGGREAGPRGAGRPRPLCVQLWCLWGLPHSLPRGPAACLIALPHSPGACPVAPRPASLPCPTGLWPAS